MMTGRIVQRPHILFCKCAHYEVIPRAVRERILAFLSPLGPDGDPKHDASRLGRAPKCDMSHLGNRPLVEVVDDLCGLAAGRDPRLQSWANAPSLAVVACFPRAVRWLFHAAGVSLPQGKVRVLNMRTQPPEEILQQLMKDDGLSMLEEESASCASANHQSSIINHPSGWVPWFPVIDYDRCKNCKQCLNFCLFGVYQLSAEGQVQVRNPSGCKTNCPACARMCPQKAIIFPKYADPPISGDERGTGVPPMSSDHGQDTRATGDILDQIRRHGAGRKRFSTEPREASSTRSCPTLEGLRRELGIPDDVLASLSPAEVQRIMSEKGPKPPSDSHPQAGEKDQKRHE